MSCMQGTKCGKSDEEAQKYADERKLILKKTSVQMQKLSDIFAAHGAEEFGWIMVDVEGAEDIVLPTIDFDRVRAELVSYEEEHPVAFAHLQKSGYEQIMQVGSDKFFARTSVIEASRVKYGIEALLPNESGKCWFHGQVAHKIDREVFKRLGGKIGECEAAPVKGARYTSEAEICDCTAPAATNFEKLFLEIERANSAGAAGKAVE